MEIRIRKADLSDTPAITRLLRSLGTFPHMAAETPQETEARVRRHYRLCRADDSHLVLVAEGSGDAFLGYASVHWLPYLLLAGPEGYVSELFVEESVRGHGVGTCLLEAVQAEARRRGCFRLMLLNMKPRESYQRGFYAKAGWEERPDAANFVLVLSRPA